MDKKNKKKEEPEKQPSAEDHISAANKILEHLKQLEQRLAERRKNVAQELSKWDQNQVPPQAQSQPQTQPEVRAGELPAASNVDLPPLEHTQEQPKEAESAQESRQENQLEDKVKNIRQEFQSTLQNLEKQWSEEPETPKIAGNTQEPKEEEEPAGESPETLKSRISEVQDKMLEETKKRKQEFLDQKERLASTISITEKQLKDTFLTGKDILERKENERKKLKEEGDKKLKESRKNIARRIDDLDKERLSLKFELERRNRSERQEPGHIEQSVVKEREAEIVKLTHELNQNKIAARLALEALEEEHREALRPLRDKIAALNTRISIANEQTAKLVKEKDERIEKYREQLAEREENLRKRAEEEEQMIETERQRLIAEIETMPARIAEEKERLEKLFAAKDEAIAQLKAEITSQANLAARQTEELRRLHEEEKSALSEQLSSMTSELDNMKNQHKTASLEKNRELQNLKYTLAGQASSQGKTLHAQMEAWEKERNELEYKSTRERMAMDALKKEWQPKLSALEDAEKQLRQELDETVKKSQVSLAELKQKHEAAIATKRQGLSALTQKLAKTQDKYSSELTVYDTAIDELTEQLQDAQAKNDLALQAGQENFERERARLKSEIEAIPVQLNEETARLEKICAGKEELINRLKAEISSYDVPARQLEELKGAHEEKKAQVSAQISGVAGELENIRNQHKIQVSEKNNELLKLKSAIAEQTAGSQQLLRDREKAWQEEKNGLEHELSRSRLSQDTLKRKWQPKINSLEAAINKLHQKLDETAKKTQENAVELKAKHEQAILRRKHKLETLTQELARTKEKCDEEIAAYETTVAGLNQMLQASQEQHEAVIAERQAAFEREQERIGAEIEAANQQAESQENAYLSALEEKESECDKLRLELEQIKEESGTQQAKQEEDYNHETLELKKQTENIETLIAQTKAQAQSSVISREMEINKIKNSLDDLKSRTRDHTAALEAKIFEERAKLQARIKERIEAMAAMETKARDNMALKEKELSGLKEKSEQLKEQTKKTLENTGLQHEETLKALVDVLETRKQELKNIRANLQVELEEKEKQCINLKNDISLEPARAENEIKEKKLAWEKERSVLLEALEQKKKDVTALQMEMENISGNLDGQIGQLRAALSKEKETAARAIEEANIRFSALVKEQNKEEAEINKEISKEKYNAHKLTGAKEAEIANLEKDLRLIKTTNQTETSRLEQSMAEEKNRIQSELEQLKQAVILAAVAGQESKLTKERGIAQLQQEIKLAKDEATAKQEELNKEHLNRIETIKNERTRTEQELERFKTMVQAELAVKEQSLAEIREKINKEKENNAAALAKIQEARDQEKQKLVGELGEKQSALATVKETWRLKLENADSEIGSLKSTLAKINDEAAKSLEEVRIAAAKETASVNEEVKQTTAQLEFQKEEYNRELARKENTRKSLADTLEHMRPDLEIKLSRTKDIHGAEQAALHRELKNVEDAIDRYENESKNKVLARENEIKHIKQSITATLASGQSERDKFKVETGLEKQKFKEILDKLKQDELELAGALKDKDEEIKELSERIKTLPERYETEIAKLKVQAVSEKEQLANQITRLKEDAVLRQAPWKERIGSLDNELAQLKSQSEELIKAEESEKIKLETRLTRFKQRIDYIESKYTERMEQARQKLAGHLSEKAGEITRIHKEIAGKESELKSNLERTGREFTEERYRLSKIKDQLAQELEVLELNNRNLSGAKENEITNLKNVIEKHKELWGKERKMHLDAFQKEKADLEQSLDKIKNSFEQIAKDSEKAIKDKNDEIIRIQNEADERAKITAREVEAKQSSWQKIRDDLKVEVEKLKGSVLEAKQTQDELKKRKETELIDLSRRVEQVDKEANDQHERLRQEWNTERINLEKAIGDMGDEIKTMQTATEQTLSGKDAEIKALQDENKAAEERILKLSKDEETARAAEIAALNEEMSAVQSRMREEERRSREAIETINQKIGQMMIEIGLKEAEVNSMQLKMDRERKQALEPMEKELRERKRKLREAKEMLQLKLSAKESEISALKTRLALRLEGLRTERLRRTEELTKLQQQLTEELSKIRERADALRQARQDELATRTGETNRLRVALEELDHSKQTRLDEFQTQMEKDKNGLARDIETREVQSTQELNNLEEILKSQSQQTEALTDELIKQDAMLRTGVPDAEIIKQAQTLGWRVVQVLQWVSSGQPDKSGQESKPH